MQCGISDMCHFVSSSPNVRNGHTAMPTHLPQSWRRRGRLPARRTRQGRSSSPPPTPSSRCQQDKGTKGTLLSSPGYTCSVMHSRAEGPNGEKGPCCCLLHATIALLQPPTDRSRHFLSVRPIHALSLALRSTQHIPRLDARCRHRRMLLSRFSLPPRSRYLSSSVSPPPSLFL